MRWCRHAVYSRSFLPGGWSTNGRIIAIAEAPPRSKGSELHKALPTWEFFT